MFNDAFTKLDLAETAKLLDIINPHLAPSYFDPVTATILSIKPSFYPGYKFLDIADFSITPLVRRQVLYNSASKNSDSIIIMNWSNEPLYRLNIALPIQLDDKNVIEYARFFFTYVRGRQGRFIVAENVDDIPWREDPPPQARKALAKMLIPVEIKEVLADKYCLQATMIFKDSLFKADIEVALNGFVTMSGEQLLVEDMPVLDDALGL